MDKIEGSEQFIPVEKITVHPGWNDDLANGYNDHYLYIFFIFVALI